jgi:uncharacterized RDD family membrane protein YckC
VTDVPHQPTPPEHVPPASPPAAPAQPGYGAPPANPYEAPGYGAAGAVAPGSRQDVEQRYGPVADFGARAQAYLIDFALSLIGLIPMLVGLILVIAGVPKEVQTYDQFGQPVYGDGNGALVAVGVILMGIGGLVSLAIAIWNRWIRAGRTGQSVGKRVVGLMLISTKTGQPIGVGQAFLRDLVHSLVNQVVYLSFLWMLWDPDKQTVADKAVTSTVIRVAKQPARV